MMNYINLPLLLLGTLTRSVNSSLRGIADGIDHFSCTVKIGDGVPLPGSEDIEERLFCLADDGDEFINRQVFDIVGDYESFFSQFSLSSGNVRIKVPFDVVTKQDEILLNEDSFKSITIIDNGEDRRLQTIPKVGTKRVLVIRVSDDNDTSGEKKVRFSANELSNHIFNMNNNNLATIYNQCSNGKLQIKEAIANQVSRGVVEIKAPSNICEMNFVQVGNWATTQLASVIDEAERNAEGVLHKMFVLPNNNCVDFRQGAAWGQVYGDTTWIQSWCSSYPIVQVHELGHNLGFSHSGGETSYGFREYGDGNCYMGNRAIWDKEGSDMCFNSAKMWHMQWFSDHHRTIIPETGKVQEVELVSLADLHDGKADKNDDLIIRLQGGDKPYYINYNRAKGINQGVRGDPDKIVITEQKTHSSKSIIKAALSQKQKYIETNWGGQGKLIVEVTKIRFGTPDIATIRISLEGGVVEEEDGCVDYIPNGEDEWYDKDGPYYNCAWYASESNHCEIYGNSLQNFGKVANQACCACKDNSSQTPRPTPAPTSAPTVAPTKSPTKAPTQAPTTSKNNGGEKCVDYVPSKQEKWFDSDGSYYDCDWYASSAGFCDLYGNGLENFGKTAKEACCVCQ